jgi:bacterioferritin-associated ferredoxin
MKKIIIALGLVASFIVLTGCASHCNSCEKAAPAVVHKDLKGEVSKK